MIGIPTNKNNQIVLAIDDACPIKQYDDIYVTNSTIKYIKQ